MTDGSLAWSQWVAAQCQGREIPQRGRGSLNGGIALLPALRRSLTAGLTCGALEPEVLAERCEGVSRPDLIEEQNAPGSKAGQAIAAVFKAGTRDEWLAFNNEHDAMIEPMLELDEALGLAARHRAGDGGRDGAAGARARPPARASDQRPGDATRPAPALGEHTTEVLGGWFAGGRSRRSSAAADEPAASRRFMG